MSIGEISRKKGEENERKISEFFTSNPFATQLDCAKHTGLSKVTVNRHFQKLRNANKGASIGDK